MAKFKGNSSFCYIDNHIICDTLKKILIYDGAVFLLMRSPNSHLDFDLDLAKKHSNKNPVYYKCNSDNHSCNERNYIFNCKGYKESSFC